MLCLVNPGNVKKAEQSHGGPDVGEGVLQLAGDAEGGVTSNVNLKPFK